MQQFIKIITFLTFFVKIYVVAKAANSNYFYQDLNSGSGSLIIFKAKFTFLMFNFEFAANATSVFADNFHQNNSGLIS